jgi:hypothetical protein
MSQANVPLSLWLHQYRLKLGRDLTIDEVSAVVSTWNAVWNTVAEGQSLDNKWSFFAWWYTYGGAQRVERELREMAFIPGSMSDITEIVNSEIPSIRVDL